MQNQRHAVGGLQAPEFSFAYSYLGIGILLLVGVFIFLPRVTGS